MIYGMISLINFPFRYDLNGFLTPDIDEAPDRKKKRGIIHRFTNARKISTDSLCCGFFTCQ
jgi:hypothetical protein